MKLYIIIPLLMLFHQMGVSQQKTEAYFGVSGRTDVCNDILEMYDKSYYISGGFEGSGDYHFGWNIKTDINLEMVYNKVFEHSLCTVGGLVSVSDDQGNIYVSGVAEISGGWPFVTKLNSCGEKQWCKILDYSGNYNYGWGEDIILTENNEIVILSILIAPDQYEQIHLIALNVDGDVLWKKPYASKYNYPWIVNASAFNISEINHDYYISGYCYWPYPNDTNHVYLRSLFIGIDSLFNEKWILPFAPLDSVFGDAFNTIAINDTVLMGVGYRIGEYNKNSILMFFSDDGEELGFTQISNEAIGNDIDFNAIQYIERINDSLFISPYYLGIGGETYFGEFVIDTSGTIYKSEIRGVYKNNSSIIKTSDNNFLIEIEVAESKSDMDIYLYKIDENLQDVPFDPTPHTYDSLCPGGIQSGTISLTDCFVWTNIGEAPSPQEYYTHVQTIPIKAYPNPVTKGTVTFEFENTQYNWNMELRCFNVYGELVHKEKVYKHQGESKVDIQNWQKGIYFATVYSNGLPVGRCKFVVQ